MRRLFRISNFNAASVQRIKSQLSRPPPSENTHRIHKDIIKSTGAVNAFALFSLNEDSLRNGVFHPAKENPKTDTLGKESQTDR